MVISVHFPKASGSSFREQLKSWYGSEAVLADSNDDPVDPCSQLNLDPEGYLRRTDRIEFAPGIKAVHGHFHPSKYRRFPDATWITILREPVDNLLSIYFFWKRSRPGHALHRYFLESGLNVLRTAKLPALTRLMSQTFFGGVDMQRFAFIGRYDRLHQEYGRIARLLDRPLAAPPLENKNPFPQYEEERERMINDAKLMARLRDILREDIAFYERYAGTTRS